MLRGWLLLPFLCALATAGCSYEYRVDAVFINDRLHFVSDYRSSTVVPCNLHAFTVSEPTGKVMWSIERADDIAARTTCEPLFPLRFGSVPVGTKTVTKAQMLEPGKIYVISGGASGSFSGVFRYEVKRLHRLTNFGSNTSEARGAREAFWSNGNITDLLEAVDEEAPLVIGD